MGDVDIELLQWRAARGGAVDWPPLSERPPLIEQPRVRSHAHKTIAGMPSKEYMHRWYLAHRDEENAKARRRQKENRAACAARKRSWRKRNPEKTRENNRRNCHRREALKRGQMGVVCQWYVKKLFALQHGRCFHCAEPLPAEFDIDHLRPYAMGGLHDDGNLALSCKPCNNARGGREDASPGPLAYSMI